MFEFIYDWMENIAFYMVLMVAIMQMIPGNEYKKYVKFFAGMILIILLIKPLVNIFGVSEFQNREYEMQMDKIEKASEDMKNMLMEEGDGGK